MWDKVYLIFSDGSILPRIICRDLDYILENNLPVPETTEEWDNLSDIYDYSSNSFIPNKFLEDVVISSTKPEQYDEQKKFLPEGVLLWMK